MDSDTDKVAVSTKRVKALYDRLHEVYEQVEALAKVGDNAKILEGGGPLDLLQEQIIDVMIMGDL